MPVIDGQQLEDAGEAFYRALRAFGGANDYGHSASRTFVVNTFKTVAVDIAQRNGPLSAEQLGTIDSMFYLDLGGLPELAQQAAGIAGFVEQATGQLVELAHDAGSTTAGSASVVDAADKLSAAALAIGEPGEAGAAQMAKVMERLRRALPAAVPLPPAVEPQPPSDELPIAVAVAPELTPVACPARLHDDETCYAIAYASLYQDRNVVSRVGYHGFSGRIRIAKGISYRTGTYGVTRETSEQTQHIADGTLCVTDQRLLFLSDTKNLDLRFDRLLSTATGPFAIEVSRANAGAFLFDGLDTATIEAFEQLTGTPPDARLEATQEVAIEEDDDDEGPSYGFQIGRALAIAGVVALFIIVFLVAR